MELKINKIPLPTKNIGCGFDSNGFYYVPSVPTLVRVLIMNGCWILSNAFSASVEMIMWFFYFSFASAVYDVDLFAYVEPSL